MQEFLNLDNNTHVKHFNIKTTLIDNNINLKNHMSHDLPSFIKIKNLR